MPTQTDIARDWGVSQAYVSKQVKKGCPLTSLEDARKWRACFASKRPPPPRARKLQQVDEERNDDSPEARTRRNEFFDGTPDGALIPSTDLKDALYKAIVVSDEAHRLVLDAMEARDDSTIQVRVGIHNKALEGRIKVEAAIQELEERRKILIPFDAATLIYRRGLDVILRSLKRFAQEKAAACNPQNPLHALGILEEGMESLIMEAQAQYAPAA